MSVAGCQIYLTWQLNYSALGSRREFFLGRAGPRCSICGPMRAVFSPFRLLCGRAEWPAGPAGALRAQFPTRMALRVNASALGPLAGASPGPPPAGSCPHPAPPEAYLLQCTGRIQAAPPLETPTPSRHGRENQGENTSPTRRPYRHGPCPSGPRHLQDKKTQATEMPRNKGGCQQQKHHRPVRSWLALMMPHRQTRIQLDNDP